MLQHAPDKDTSHHATLMGFHYRFVAALFSVCHLHFMGNVYHCYVANGRFELKKRKKKKRRGAKIRLSKEMRGDKALLSFIPTPFFCSFPEVYAPTGQICTVKCISTCVLPLPTASNSSLSSILAQSRIVLFPSNQRHLTPSIWNCFTSSIEINTKECSFRKPVAGFSLIRRGSVFSGGHRDMQAHRKFWINKIRRPLYEIGFKFFQFVWKRLNWYKRRHGTRQRYSEHRIKSRDALALAAQKTPKCRFFTHSVRKNNPAVHSLPQVKSTPTAGNFTGTLKCENKLA